MKRLILIAFLSFCGSHAFSKTNTFIGLRGGAGIAVPHNYDLSLYGGLDFTKGLFNRTALGLSVFYQSFGVVHDNEAFGFKDGNGTAGTTLLHQSAYVFVAPRFEYGIGKKENIHFYINGGVGFNMGGKESIRKWDESFGAGPGNYDSVIDASANINKMVARLGLGFVQYLHMGRHWRFTISEDMGFLPQSLTVTGSAADASRTRYTPAKINPTTISLHLGIAYIRIP